MATTDTDVEDPGLGFSAEEAPVAKRPPRRKRPRIESLAIDKEKIVERVLGFYEEDMQDRVDDIEARLQRYAKYRMWTEGKDWPWEDASDAAIPDMMTHSLKVQDTLHNAVMSTRPAIVTRARIKANTDKEKTVNELLDAQFFVENKGEHIVGEMADAFVNDGVVTVFVPWVREEREVHELYTLPAPPEGREPQIHFDTFLRATYSGAVFKKRDADGWSWEVMSKDGEWFDVDFWTVGDKVEMDAKRKAVVFDGPRPIVKDYEDVLTPARCANLQIPGPSNPGGAPHVILVDYPTLDEVKRLEKSGFYDLSGEEVKKLESAPRDDTTGQEEKEQKDRFQGVVDDASVNDGPADGSGKSPDHKTLTRLTCFDIFDIDGDGVNEDVVFWVIKETKQLLRVRELTQVYPLNPPRRPFGETSFIPVRGRRCGISLLEMMEGLHDLIKQFADQTVDRGTITNVPFGFYRASGSMRPEVLRMWPGELYPLGDPKNDIHFPTLPQDGSSFGFNLMSIFSQMEERLTNIGDLQLGRVPQGKASALRTVRGMQAVMGQGEARPERILRRFFMGLAETFAVMHGLNQVLLPRDKLFRVSGVPRPNEDPFRRVSDPSELRGEFVFDFVANAMNTSKEALQSALDELMGIYITPVALQLGVMDAEGVYNLLRDAGKARGQDADKYLKPPSPESNLPKLFAEEVVTLIMAGNMPECRPAEANAMEHLKKLMDFAGKDEFGYLTEQQVVVFRGYLTMLRQRMQAEARDMALQQAAAQFQGGGAPGVPGPQGTAPIDTANPPLQKNELLDESLPGAGGGGNPGPMVQ